jgi:hypothetical protein
MIAAAGSDCVRIITSHDPEIRNRSLDSVCSHAPVDALLYECEALERFRRSSTNLYQKVRALFFLYAIHRFYIPEKTPHSAGGSVPWSGHIHLLNRRFEEAIELFATEQNSAGPGPRISSALAAAYRALGFQTLADQVRQSVRSLRGNQWMFRTGHPADYPLTLRPEILRRAPEGLFPILRETTPVRMDLTHSAWSDIFFLGMDFPEGARVLNVSIDLAVRGPDSGPPIPPVEAYLRVIDEPVLRLTSVDLKATADLTSVAELFDFAGDYLGLLKSAVIAAGLVPPGMEGAPQPLAHLLERLTRIPGCGIEIVSKVNGIPKGSRLAVSTNLLASLIAVCMRATGQIRALTGPLAEEERRIVAARAILGEWLGGSGGGWQDSGGVWPGIKRIEAVIAGEGDPEFGISRGCLLPRHYVFGSGDITAETRRKLQDTLVLVHGGMAQDVGPVLEMVTEKYLLRSEREWRARRQANCMFDEIEGHLRTGNIRAIAETTQRNFDGPIQTIIPWAGNLYTQTLIERIRGELGSSFQGFWMLGGMSGGGMGFMFDPDRKEYAQDRLKAIMSETKRKLERALPFAMEPVVYDFAINEHGTQAQLLEADSSLMPPEYYSLLVPGLLRVETSLLSPGRRRELASFNEACRNVPRFRATVRNLFDSLLPRHTEAGSGAVEGLAARLHQHGFDPSLHQNIQAGLRSGRLGLAQNRLPLSTSIEDVLPNDVVDVTNPLPAFYRDRGMSALAQGEIAVVTLAGGVGSRWTRGAGVVKALSPFCRFAGRHRSFLGLHLAKSLRTGRMCGVHLPHIVTTSYLTHDAVADYLAAEGNFGYPGPVLLSPGRTIGLRMVPTERDLRFAWQDTSHQVLDRQAQKVRESLQSALIAWARRAGEANDYTDNEPLQCLHPVGHWFEVPSLFRNGVLQQLLRDRPQLRYLFVHNVDTTGAAVDPELFGWHIEHGAPMTFEVISRHIEDAGGGLARVDGRARIVEGMALPSQEIESRLSFYSSNTVWIDIDLLLAAFGLQRSDLDDSARVAEAVNHVASRMPTYLTIKEVKKRWGRAQEDVYPVMQFEKLWGDMTALYDLDCRFIAVSRRRGQQLKEVSQLDGWLRDGSFEYVDSLCDWSADR